MMMANHFYHLVTVSPWPILMALSLLNLSVSVINWMKISKIMITLMFMFQVSVVVYQWWRDAIREANLEGSRSTKINTMISFGMILFIISEICFFSSFFWSFFYSSLSPDVTLGLTWPPLGIKNIDFLGIPLLNTLTLLTSGLFITWSHHNIISNLEITMTKLSLLLSIIMGLYFMMMQMYEYVNLQFSFSDSIYGSTFFALTGFHGLHVLVGLVFITINLVRTLSISFSMSSLFGLEYSIWYWHFVDLVWLFLYCAVYWWSS